MSNAIRVAGTPFLIHSFFKIGVLFDDAFAVTTTQAVDQIGVAFHPKPTQNTIAHQRRSTP